MFSCVAVVCLIAVIDISPVRGALLDVTLTSSGTVIYNERYVCMVMRDRPNI